MTFQGRSRVCVCVWGGVGEGKKPTLAASEPGVIHSLALPVIVAEIGAQSVDIQEQSHGAAQRFCEHLSASRARGKEQNSKTKNKNKNRGGKKQQQQKCQRCQAGRRGAVSPGRSPLSLPVFVKDV